MGIFTRRPADAVTVTEEPPTETRSHAGWYLPSPVSSAATADILAGWPGSPDAAALAIPTAYRCVEFIATKVGKFVPFATRNGEPAAVPNPLLRRPDPGVSRFQFISDTVTSMLTTGNAYWLVTATDAAGAALAVEVVNPRHVTVSWAPGDFRQRHRVFDVLGVGRLGPTDLIQVPMILLPGALTGLGPVGASRALFAGQLGADNLAASNFQEGVFPTGAFVSETAVSSARATEIQNEMIERHAGSRKPFVLSGGLTYEPFNMSAADAQWIEHRQWTAGDIARLFGVPAGLLSLPVGGSNLTYTNIRDARVEAVNMALDPLMCRIGSAFEALGPLNETVDWDVSNYLPDVDAAATDADANLTGPGPTGGSA